MKYFLLCMCLIICSCDAGLTVPPITYEIGETVYIQEFRINGTLREIKDGDFGSVIVLLDVNYMDETGKINKKIIKTYISRIQKIQKIKEIEPKTVEVENGK